MVAGRVGAKQVCMVEGRWSKPVCDWPTQDTGLHTGWAGYCCCFPHPHHFLSKDRPFLPGELCFSSLWDFSCYLRLEAWKGWLKSCSVVSLKHSLAQLFFHLLHVYASSMDLLRYLCASRTIWKAWGHLGTVWGDRTEPEIQWMKTLK